MEQPETASPLIEKADSLRHWSDVIRQRFIAVQIAPHASFDLSGSVRTRFIGHLQASVVSSIPQTFNRTQRQTSTPGEIDLLAVAMVDRGTAYLEQDGRRCELSNGAFTVYETSRPFNLTVAQDYRLCVFTWPREAIALPDGLLQRCSATAISGTAGLGQFVSPMLGRLIASGLDASPRAAIAMASEVADLAILAAGETHSVACLDVGPEMVGRIQLFIEQNLADPALSPEAIAQEFYMSPRTLRRVFAQSGFTITAWIKHRRLEACRRALISPLSRSTPISEIAARYGFSSLAVFSREFASHYGIPPSRYRAGGPDSRAGSAATELQPLQ